MSGHVLAAVALHLVDQLRRWWVARRHTHAAAVASARHRATSFLPSYDDAPTTSTRQLACYVAVGRVLFANGRRVVMRRTECRRRNAAVVSPSVCNSLAVPRWGGRGAQAPKSWLGPKFSRTLKTRRTIDSQKK